MSSDERPFRWSAISAAAAAAVASDAIYLGGRLLRRDNYLQQIGCDTSSRSHCFGHFGPGQPLVQTDGQTDGPTNGQSGQA